MKIINPYTKDARSLRISLIATLVIVAVGSFFAVYYAVSYIQNYAIEVNDSVTQAAEKAQKNEDIKRLTAQLDKMPTDVARINQVVADSKSYQYQDRIIGDLNSMAQNAGVSINSFDFTSNSKSSVSQAPTGNVSQQGDSNTTTPSSSAIPLKSTSVTITLKSPVEYANLMQFIYNVEQNLTKMQLAGITMSSAPNSTGINIDSMNIEVYIK